ncbi:MAG: hypothetical protein HOQ34_18405 [Gemmatimonadaceae bacterium]|nr:hypothetical protein [Gemmatimonadaceae bacterium]
MTDDALRARVRKVPTALRRILARWWRRHVCGRAPTPLRPTLRHPAIAYYAASYEPHPHPKRELTLHVEAQDADEALSVIAGGIV